MTQKTLTISRDECHHLLIALAQADRMVALDAKMNRISDNDYRSHFDLSSRVLVKLKRVAGEFRNGGRDDVTLSIQSGRLGHSSEVKR